MSKFIYQFDLILFFLHISILFDLGKNIHKFLRLHSDLPCCSNLNIIQAWNILLMDCAFASSQEKYISLSLLINVLFKYLNTKMPDTNM